jgi:hypothetical protein
MPEKVVTLASMTSSQAELEHAASENWRTPYVPPTEETPAGTESSNPEGKSATESETVPAEQKTEKKTDPTPESKNGWQKRVDRLTARNKSIETENATLRAQLDEVKRSPAAPKQDPAAPAPKPAPTAGPKLADFATAEEWADARADWQRTQERQREESTNTDKEIRQTWDAHNSRISEARAKYDDFDEVAQTFGNIEIPQSAAMAIIEQPNSADVAYYLATHQEEAKKLAGLRPIQQIAAIVKISDKVAAPVIPAPAKPKPASQAPAPIKPVGGAATGSTTDLGSMSYQDYKKARTNGHH